MRYLGRLLGSPGHVGSFCGTYPRTRQGIIESTYERVKRGFTTREGSKVCRLPAGAEWIRTFSSGASGEAGAILPVKDRPRYGGSAPPGSACCVVVGNGGCEAYTVIGWRGGLSHGAPGDRQEVSLT